MIIGDLKNLIAGYLGTTTTEFVINGVDLLLTALNNARREAEKQIDFEFAKSDAQLIIPAITGEDLTEATFWGGAAPITIKRIRNVLLPVASSDYMPVEFMQADAWTRRVKLHTGRAVYDPTKSLATLGFAQTNPVAVQSGTNLSIYASSGVTFPVTAWLQVFRFLSDYDADADEDFICRNGAEYLLWQGVLEANKQRQRFVPRQEGMIDEAAVEKMAQDGLMALLAWDRGQQQGTTTPAQAPMPQHQTAKKGK